MQVTLRSLEWMGDSLKQLKNMPDDVVHAMGFQLQQAQAGRMPALAKPFKGVGSGVFEIVKRYDGDTYRAVYAVQIGTSVYVLHSFMKKSKKGVATAKKDVDLIKKRYKEAVTLEKQKEKNDGKKN